MMGRLPALDGLRAIAILIVMVSHAGLGHIVPGNFGVTIFFFLSGYLITTLMVSEWDRTERLDFSAFYLRRVVRIIPPMVVAIGITTVLALAGYMRPMNYSGLTWDFLFLTNYASLFGETSNIPIPLWSLDVEEHFYLLFPLLFAFVRRRGQISAVALACVLLCVLVLLVRMTHAFEAEMNRNIYYWSHTRIDSIIYGCILACWNNPSLKGRTFINGHIVPAFVGAAFILATFIIRDPVFRETLRYSLQGVGLFLIFNYALRNQGIVSRLLAHPVLKVIADLSYFLYLIHLPMVVFVSHFTTSPGLLYAGAFALSFLSAALVRQHIELPLLRWRKRIELKPNVKVSIP